jgi:hypothetical protein
MAPGFHGGGGAVDIDEESDRASDSTSIGHLEGKTVLLISTLDTKGSESILTIQEPSIRNFPCLSLNQIL